MSPGWLLSGSFSSSEEGEIELLKDKWASKTFTFGEGETGFSASCDGLLALAGWLGLVLEMTQFYLCHLKCFLSYSKKG